MKRNLQIKQTALLLSLAYLFLSSFMMIEMGGHALKHGHATHHAAQHASVTCAWMCAVSVGLYFEGPKPTAYSHPSFQKVDLPAELPSSSAVLPALLARPPPFSLT